MFRLRRETLAVAVRTKPCCWRHRGQRVQIGVIFSEGGRIRGSSVREIRVVGGSIRRRSGSRWCNEGLDGNRSRNLGLDHVEGLSTIGHPWSDRSQGKLRTIQNQPAQLRNSNPLHRVTVENATQDIDHLIGQRKNGLEEERILQVRTEGGILDGGPFPWITATRQVDQDNPQAPDIIGSRSVAGHWSGILLLAFFFPR